MIFTQKQINWILVVVVVVVDSGYVCWWIELQHRHTSSGFWSAIVEHCAAKVMGIGTVVLYWSRPGVKHKRFSIIQSFGFHRAAMIRLTLVELLKSLKHSIENHI